MTRIIPLVVALGFALTSSACLVTSRPHHNHHSAKSSRGCHPSQYWDGHKCRHKGKGHGARKHDGRR